MYNKEERVLESGYVDNERFFVEQTSDSIALKFPVIDFTRNRLKSEELTFKRIMDITGASLGLVGLSIFFPVIAILIKLSSRGSVFFIQERVGLNGKIFRCYKFRTMKCGNSNDNEDNEIEKKPDITLKGDPRVFLFGRFLRKTNIDELPQLINVLKGDMSLVGPRPIMVDECRYWRSIIPNWTLRYAVKPGITGWAQVMGYRGGNLDPLHMHNRLKRDFKYIENYSTKLDLEIIWRTAKQMILHKTKAH